MEIDNNVIFEKLCDYYNELVKRRWQYFIAFILVTGLMLNVIKESNNNVIEKVIEVVSFTNIIIAIVFLRLVSRIRKRIKTIGDKINDLVAKNIYETGKDNSLGLNGITIWIYLAIIVISGLWFTMLYENNKILFGISTTVFLVNTLTIRWKHKE